MLSVTWEAIFFLYFLLFSAFNFLLSIVCRWANLNRVSVPQISFFVCIRGKCGTSWFYYCPAFHKSLPRAPLVGCHEPRMELSPDDWQPCDLGWVFHLPASPAPHLQGEGRDSFPKDPCAVWLQNDCRVLNGSEHLLWMSAPQKRGCSGIFI